MVTNSEIADLFEELADLTRIADGSSQSFRARAYQAATKTIRHLPQPVADLSEPQLRGISGIGKSTASYIREYVETGRLGRLDSLRKQYPPDFQELVRVPGLGPKRAVTLREALGVDSVDALIEALDARSVRELSGFGRKTEENLRRSIERLGWSGKERRTPILVAMKEAQRLVNDLKTLPGVDRVAYAGSLRRFRETVADLDILVATSDSGVTARLLRDRSWVGSVLAAGETKTSVLTHSGLQVDVRMVPEHQWGAALLYFTGSKEHNIRLRRLAIEQEWVLSEYALYHSETEEVIAQQTEQDIYRALGMAWVPPPIREDQGEVEESLGGRLPDLVEEGDLRGDLHVHTDMSGDGQEPLQAMLDKAVAKGLEYIAITDHAEDLAINGVGREAMLGQRHYIHRLRPEYPTLHILHGAELNIGRDGSLDYDLEFLMGYDWCVASVHSYFDLPREEQTARVITAMAHPAVDVIGHLQGRRIGRRPPIDLDIGAILEAAELTGTALEINSNLDRLDVSAEVLLQAQGRPVLFVISSDAHDTGEMDQTAWGVLQAKRGRVVRDRIANTWPADRFLDWTRTRRATSS
ncbi:MAG: DNA polymerase/3'-5' exonuclease PolX [Acidimicrobiia bacterium]|nr:DNA polymerase/3'-5' exonuclease PolX [Acidimicrobiia bacterium]